MPMMPFIGVRISWLMLARNSLFARLASIARSRAVTSSSLLVWSSAVRASTVRSRSSCCSEQLLIALLDVGQHRVELIDQLADFVVVAGVGADVVAAAVAHQARHLDQPRDRVEDQPRGRARQAERNPERAEQRARGDRREAREPGPDLGRVGLHLDAADDLAVERNRPDDAQAVALEQATASTPGGVASSGAAAGRGDAGTHVGREQRAVAREQPRVEDVLVDRRGAQRLGRRRGVLEGQRRGAVGADDVGEHRDVADQARPAG